MAERSIDSKVKKESAFTLRGADGIRALACLAVMLHHVSQRLSVQWQPSPVVRDINAFLLLGNTGVSVFFVLSGFLLSYPFWKQFFNGGQFPDIKQYAVRRAARIMPGYYLSFVVCSLIILIFGIPSQYFWIRALSGLTFTAGFNYVTFFPNEINGPFWSIGFEVFCYLLMPLFMFVMYRLIRKKRTFLKSLIFWLAVVAFVVFLNSLIHAWFTPDGVRRGWQYGIIGGAKYWMPNYNPIGFFLHFTVGILASGIAAWLFKISAASGKFGKRGGFDIICAFSLSCAFVLLWLVKRAPEFTLGFQRQPYYFPLYALLIGAFLAAAPHSNIMGRILDNPFFRYTAKVSFGLYIWHYVIIYIVSITMVKNYQVMGMTDLKSWALVSLAVFAVSYVVAALSYKFIEKPVLDRVHKRKSGGNRLDISAQQTVQQ
ncbi:MAG TPA: acyltransferase [Clostridia bacterium]|nr:acyltransferase [Clostridia bacterium]